MVLLPTIPTTLSFRTYVQLVRHCRKELSKPARLLPFLNMVDGRRKLHRQTARLVRERPHQFLQTTVPYASVVEQMGQKRAPVGEYAAASESAAAFTRLYVELCSTTIGSMVAKPDPELQALAGRHGRTEAPRTATATQRL